MKSDICGYMQVSLLWFLYIKYHLGYFRDIGRGFELDSATNVHSDTESMIYDLQTMPVQPMYGVVQLSDDT